MSIEDSILCFVHLHTQSMVNGHELPTGEGIRTEAERVTSTIARRLVRCFKEDLNQHENLKVIVAASVAEDRMLRGTGFSGVGVVDKSTEYCKN